MHPFLCEGLDCSFFLFKGGDADGEGVVLLEEGVVRCIFNYFVPRKVY